MFLTAAIAFNIPQINVLKISLSFFPLKMVFNIDAFLRKIDGENCGCTVFYGKLR